MNATLVYIVALQSNVCTSAVFVVCVEWLFLVMWSDLSSKSKFMYEIVTCKISEI